MLQMSLEGNQSSLTGHTVSDQTSLTGHAVSDTVKVFSFQASASLNKTRQEVAVACGSTHPGIQL